MRKHIGVALAAALSVAGLAAVPTLADREVVVQPGESLVSISLRYYGDDSHVSEIANYNHLANPDLIFSGLLLALPDLPAAGQDGAVAVGSGMAGNPPVAATASYATSGQAESPPMPVGAPVPAAAFALPVLSTPGSPDAAPAGVTTVAASVVPSVAIDSGFATWYGPGFNGALTYCGDVYDESAFTAASNTLPCGTVVIVTNQNTGASVRVRINDRGGFGGNVILDMSRASFAVIAPMDQGVAPVTVYLPAQ